MIAHVAEAGESKGRVVLQFCSNSPSPIALEAAVRIAQAYNSEVESLFIEDQNLLHLASFPFAREVSFAGKARQISVDSLEREMRQAFRGLYHRIERLAGAAEVPVTRRIVRDDPIQALQAACTDCGPWNLVALADPFSASSFASLARLFERVTDATGLLLVGPAARRSGGRIVIMSDAGDDLANLMRVARRLAAIDNADIRLALVSDNESGLRELEAHARLVLAEDEGLQITTAVLASGHEAGTEILRRLVPGFVITRFGGLLVPIDSNLRSLSTLECPLLLVR